jgi:hypothetical protein
MKIHCFTFDTLPTPESKNFVECGGAIIVCWIKSDSKSDAENIAKKYIQSDG